MCYSALSLSGHYCLQVTIAPAYPTCSVSSTDSEFIDDDEFLDLLRSWAAKFNITHIALQSLLAILRPHHTGVYTDKERRLPDVHLTALAI